MMNEKPIVHYEICSAYDHVELAGYVNKAIQMGYQPLGGLFQSTQRKDGNEVTYLHQVLILHGAVTIKKQTISLHKSTPKHVKVKNKKANC